MATRILSSWYLLGQDVDFPATNFSESISLTRLVRPPLPFARLIDLFLSDGWDLTDEATNQHVNVQEDHYK